MTSVFFSYARAERERVEPLIALIRSVVAEVWWDDRLVAGEAFGEEIERQIDAADFVVVAWSRSSLRSTYVLDEAGAGRDASKLIPISLDGQMPPIGFRQIHTTDFSNWRGGADEKCALALKAALTRQPIPKSAPMLSPTASRPNGLRRVLPIAAVVFVLLIAAAAVVRFAPKMDEGPPPGSIAVLPFADLSPGKDRGYFGEGIAEEILSALARYPALTVIGRTSAAQFAGPSVDVAEVRRALNVEHVVEGSVRPTPGRIKITVALVRTRDGVRVWSDEHDRPEAEIFAIADEIGQAVARRAGGVEGGTTLPVAASSMDSFDLLLDARQKLRTRQHPQMIAAKEQLERARAMDPKSAAILGALAEALSLLVGTVVSRDTAEKEGRALADRAIALAPDRADGYAALAHFLPQGDAAKQVLDKAIALDPSRSDLRLWRAAGSKSREDYVAALRGVIAFDPLWYRPVRDLAFTLVRLGRLEEANRAIDDYAARAPDDGFNPPMIRSQIAAARGDMTTAYEEASAIEPQNEEAIALRSHVLATVGLDEKVRTLIPEPRNPIDAWRRRDPDLMLKMVMAYPSDFRSGHPFELLGQFGRHGEIVGLFDARLGTTAAFCARLGVPGAINAAPSLVLALRASARGGEAAEIATCTIAELKRKVAADEDARGELSEKGVALFYLAQLDAIEGRNAAALETLLEADALLYVGQRYSLDLGQYRAFDGLRDEPAFRALEARLDAQAARQRTAILEFDEAAARVTEKAG